MGDITGKMTKAWTQLACALLLQKLDVTNHPNKTTFENAAKADMNPIAVFGRSESTTINPVMAKMESIRDFGARCRDGQQYAAWVRGLGTQSAMEKESGVDTDTRLFTIMADNLPSEYRFLYFIVNTGTAPGSKLGALRVLLDGEAHKLKSSEPAVRFADDYEEHGLVALNSRLARDPAGKPTSETCSESYSKNVKTKYEPQGGLNKQAAKKRGKKDIPHDSSSEEEPAADVSAITTA